jgi:hypothetical protein
MVEPALVHDIRDNGVLVFLPRFHIRGRGLHSSTFRLNVRSAFCGIGGAFRDCLGIVLRVFRRCLGVVLKGVKGVLRVRYGSG